MSYYILNNFTIWLVHRVAKLAKGYYFIWRFLSFQIFLKFTTISICSFSINLFADNIGTYPLSGCSDGSYLCTPSKIKYQIDSGAISYSTPQEVCDAIKATNMNDILGLMYISTEPVYDPAVGFKCFQTTYNTRYPSHGVSTGYSGENITPYQYCQPETLINVWLSENPQLDPVTHVKTMLCGYALNYNLVFIPESPKKQCSVGNPVEVNNGAKNQTETDINSKGVGQVNLDRYYSNSNLSSESLWHHNYDMGLLVIDPNNDKKIIQKGRSFSDRAMACGNGWYAIKSTISDTWAANTYASFNGKVCQIINATNGTVVRSLPLVLSDGPLTSMSPDAVQLRRPDGSTLSFQYNRAAGQFVSLDGDQGNLSWLNSNVVSWRYTSKENEIYEFSVDGKLLFLTASNGMKQTLTYDSVSGLLTQVRDNAGGKLTFSYIGTRLSSVTTGDNKITNYSYNSSGLITDVKYPDNTHRLYYYEDSRFPTYLTGITDERGVRYAAWTYDAQGRAVSSAHTGGAEKTSLAFNADNSTTVTNALNKQTIYRFADIAGVRRVVKVEGQPTTNCVGANQNYTYTPEGWVASKTDWSGNETRYVYNTKGQEISRVEAFGSPVAKTITTEWHTTFNLKTKVTEPDKETTYSYDVNGLLLNKNTRSLP